MFTTTVDIGYIPTGGCQELNLIFFSVLLLGLSISGNRIQTIIYGTNVYMLIRRLTHDILWLTFSWLHQSSRAGILVKF